MTANDEYNDVYVSDVEKRLVILHGGIQFLLNSVKENNEKKIYQNLLLTLSVGFPEIEKVKKILKERDEWKDS